MAVTTDQLRNYLGAGPDASVEELDRWLTLATESLDAALDTTPVADGGGQVAIMPESVRYELILEIASEFSRRRDSPVGAGQFATMESSYPVRGPRDPLQQVRLIIARYTVPF